MPVGHTPVKDSKEKMPDLKSIIHLRGQAKAKITRIRRAIEEAAAAGAQYDAAQLKVFSRNLENHFQEYLGLHHQVMAVCPSERIEEQDQGYLTFEIHYNETCVLVERAILAACQVPVIQPQQIPANENPRIIIQQQPLKAPIPTFDGKPENWPRFKAMFSDVIRSSTDSDCIKLYHLERSLVGAAAGIIDARTLNDNNYAHAWEILEDRFENKRVIVDTHIQGLLNLHRMSRENPKELRELIDEVTRHVDGLALAENELDGVSDRFVVNLVAGSLDKDTRKEWEASIPHKAIPTYDDTITFLRKRCAILERCEDSSTKHPTNVKKTVPVKNPAKTYAVTGNTETTCELCDGVHPNFKCEVFLAMSIPERQAKVRELRMCYKCLRKGHLSSSCNSSRTCQKCQGKHHTLLHIDKSPSTPPTVVSSQAPSTPPTIASSQAPSATSAIVQAIEQPSKPHEVIPVFPITTTCSVSDAPHLENSLLMTALVNILDSNGKFQPCRAFLDCGSQAHLVSENLIDKLNLPRIPVNVEIIGANGKKSTLSEMAKVQIRSMHSDFQAQLECLVTDQITGVMPSRKFDVESWLLPPGLPLADPTFHTPGEIHLLIGIKLFFEILMPSQLKISDELPVLQETRLGWIIAGAVNDNPSHCQQQCHVMSLEPLAKSMESSLEPGANSPVITNEKQQCEATYCSTTQRDIDGHCTVQLPLKDSLSKLNNNRSIGLRRFFMREQRLKMNPEMKLLYVQFIDEYKLFGHCQQVIESNDMSDRVTYCLSHHHAKSSYLSHNETLMIARSVQDGLFSTLLRFNRHRYAFTVDVPKMYRQVLLDISLTAPQRISLNETLMIDPNVQNDLFSILLRVHRRLYAYTEEVSKMYCQILLDRNQTALQRIFWRKNPTEALEVLELTTVTYKTFSAPYLVNRTLKQLTCDEAERYPFTARIMIEEFSVDVLHGVDAIEEAVRSRTELTHLLKCSGFPIHNVVPMRRPSSRQYLKENESSFSHLKMQTAISPSNL